MIQNYINQSESGYNFFIILRVVSTSFFINMNEL